LLFTPIKDVSFVVLGFLSKFIISCLRTNNKVYNRGQFSLIMFKTTSTFQNYNSSHIRLTEKLVPGFLDIQINLYLPCPKDPIIIYLKGVRVCFQTNSGGKGINIPQA